MAVVLVLTTASASLHGQAIDYRFVQPASHMQHWPDDQPTDNVLPFPIATPRIATPRIATKWRTKLTPPRKADKTPNEPKPATDAPAPPAIETHTSEPLAIDEPQPEPPAAQPPAAQPPAAQPPAPEPPAAEPPATEPPATEPPATEPPATEPSAPAVDEADAPAVTVQLPLATEADPLPGPALTESSDDTEVLNLPQQPIETPTEALTKPEPQPINCYQAPPLSELSVSIGLPDGKLPTDAYAVCAEQHEPVGDARLVGAWAGFDFHWSATCMRHRPLYFEEINAERYGYTVSYTLQPVISAARFFATIPALPYKMVVERPRDCIYTLGHYRPGSCAPRRWNRLPWNFTAAVVETGFIAGMILIIP